MRKMKLSRNILKTATRFYFSDHSLKETAEMIHKKYGIKMCRDTIKNRFVEVGIAVRNRKEAAKLSTKRRVYKKRKFNERLIVKFYTKDKFSQRKLVKMFKTSDRTIREILLKNNVRVRNKEEATSLSQTRSIKISFNGSSEEKAYLMGLCLGDLVVKRYTKFTIRIGTSGKENFVKFLFQIFKKYTTAIGFYRTSKGYGFHAYLNNSFQFLLDIKQNINIF